MTSFYVWLYIWNHASLLKPKLHTPANSFDYPSLPPPIAIYVDYEKVHQFSVMNIFESMFLQQNIYRLPVYNHIKHNHFHNILEVFDVLLNFLFTKSETIRVYYL